MNTWNREGGEIICEKENEHLGKRGALNGGMSPDR